MTGGTKTYPGSKTGIDLNISDQSRTEVGPKSAPLNVVKFRERPRADELHFVRTPLLQIIPRRLFEQIKDRVFDKETIDHIYEFGGEVITHPACLLYVMVNESHEIHGVLWAQMDPFESDLSVYVLSVDPEYQDGQWPVRAAKWLFSQPFKWEKLKPSILFTTCRPDAFRKIGAVDSPNVQMEMTKEALEKYEASHGQEEHNEHQDD